MPEVQMVLYELLDLTLLESYEWPFLFIFATVTESGQFDPDERAEILAYGQADREEMGDDTYGLVEFGSIDECRELLRVVDNDPWSLIAFKNGEGGVNEDIE